MRKAGKVVAMVAPAVAGALALTMPAYSEAAAHPAGVTCTYTAPGPVHKYAGVVPSGPDWPAGYQRYVTATGVHPQLVEYYQRFGQPFNTSRACATAQLGAISVIQWLPRGNATENVAAGREDSYITAFARAAKATGVPLYVSFGPEMNGRGTSWGAGNVSAVTFVRAWRRMVGDFRAAQATNVKFLWTVNKDAPGEESVAAVWPGARYVDWIGVDGYYRTPHESFQDVFGSTLTELRHLPGVGPAAGGAPRVLLSETGAAGPDRDRNAQIVNLLQNVRSNNQVAGYIWFDINAGEDWNLDNDPGAAAAFGQVPL
jgi:mannan endo-1,4-beta-mannosidase